MKAFFDAIDAAPNDVAGVCIGIVLIGIVLYDRYLAGRFSR